MDKKFTIPSSSSETPCHVLNSPESELEICEQTKNLAISSTSAGENIPKKILELIPNISPKRVVMRELHLNSTENKVLADAEEIKSSINRLLADQKDCNEHVKQIKKEFNMLTNYLNIPTSSADELVNEFKLRTASKLRNAEKHTNTNLSLIVEALISIKQQLHLPFSGDAAVHEALSLLNKSMKVIYPTQEEHKADLRKIKQSLLNNPALPPAADQEVVQEFHSLTKTMEWIIAELNAHDKLFYDIKELNKSIRGELSSRQSKLSKAENAGNTDKNPETL